MLKPLASNRWTTETAAHLLNRAGFGGPPAEIQQLADQGLTGAVAHFVDYEDIPDQQPAPEWAHNNADELRELQRRIKNVPPEEKNQLRKQQFQDLQKKLVDLRGWWFERMRHTPRPLQEKMVLFWHGHFATSYEKVRNPYFIWRQNDIFRRLATGNWLLMLTEVGKDPAMLIWLDQAQSRAQHPNENYAREVMELFSLGEGHYTEHDITEAARALTGWSLDFDTQEYVFRPYLHDDGRKTIFGQTGYFDGDDFMEMIVAHPQSSRFITAKLWNFFAGEYPAPALNDALAAVFRANGNNFKPLLRTMFAAEEFYAPGVVNNLVKSPVQWLIGTARMLECELPSPLVCAAITRSLGQDIFAPPNVKGWDGGLSWINTNTLLTRYNEANALLTGSLDSMTDQDFALRPGGQGGQYVKRLAERTQRYRTGGVAVAKLVPPEDRADHSALALALQKRLLPIGLSLAKQKTLADFLSSKPVLTDADIIAALHLIMSTPEYQVA